MTPAGNDPVVMVSGGGGLTVIVSAWVAETPVASTTLKVTGLLPGPVGVPEIVTEFVVLDPMVIPAGSVPEEMLHVNGLVPPLALIVAE